MIKFRLDLSQRNGQKKESGSLKSRKTVCSNVILAKILKNFEDVFATFIYNNCNKSLLDGTFPEDFKTAEVVPVYKKKKRTDKNKLHSHQYFVKYLKNL